MPTDLPTAIRAALHADEITAADLRRPVLREAPSRASRVPRVLAVAATVAVVVAVAVTISVLDSGRPGEHQAASGPSAILAGIVGYRWDVTKVQDGHGAFSVPPGRGAYIGFTRNGYVQAEDTVNFLSGRYRPVSGGYRVDDAATTLAVGSSEPQRRRLIDAVDAMFFTPAKALTPFPPANVGTVAVRVDGDTLTLTSDKADTTLTLVRAGGQPDATMAKPSSTAPPPPTASARPDGTANPTTASGSPDASPARTGLAPPDSSGLPAKGCGADPAPVVTVRIDPDTPVPSCVVVHASQRLRVTNDTDGFGQAGGPITVAFAGLPRRVVAAGGSTTYDQPFGRYLAPGQHVLRVSAFPGSDIIVWLE